jgi:uncharacterized repeat protein (TIGR01451 family)
MKRLRLLGLTLAALFVLVPTFFGEAPRAQAGTPVQVKVTITRVVELQCNEGDGEPCPNDYYPKFSIDGEPVVDKKGDYCCAHGTDFEPNWVYEKTVDSDHNPVSIKIELWDQDDLSFDDELDIAAGAPRGLDFTFDLNTCVFQGGGLVSLQGAGAYMGLGQEEGTPKGESAGNDSDRAQIFFTITSSLGCDKDTDGDGIPDGAELNPVLATKTSPGETAYYFTDMPQLGADPCRKTIALEIDYMAGAADGHSHRPKDAAVAAVQAAFANAPVAPTLPCPYAGFPKPVNPVNNQGIKLIVDVSDSIPEQPTMELDTSAFRNARDTYFTPGRRPWFHYAIFAHDLVAGSAISGRCCLPGIADLTKDFIVALGEWQTECVGPGANGVLNTTPSPNDATKTVDGLPFIVVGADGICDSTAVTDDPTTPVVETTFDVQIMKPGFRAVDAQVGTVREQAGTIMHELGHALGLGHGGDSIVNFKPNYLSVMNYAFDPSGIIDPNLPNNNVDFKLPLDGVPETRMRLDYSRAALGALTETALNENAGIGDGTDVTQWFDTDGRLRTGPGNKPLNWNGNTMPGTGADIIDPGTVNVDVNSDGGCVGRGPNLTLNTLPVGDDVVIGDNVEIVQYIGNGPDHACNTRLDKITPANKGDDVQLNGPNLLCVIFRGTADTTPAPGSDDRLLSDGIGVGSDFICNTARAGDDIQLIPVGQTEFGPLTGYDDWQHLEYRAGRTAGGDGAGHATPDITVAEALNRQLSVTAYLSPDLKATKTVDKADAAPGEKLNYAVGIQNIGTGPATEVTVVDTLPNGTPETRTLSNLGPGGSTTPLFEFQVPCTTTDLTVLTNSATVSAKNVLGQPEVDTSNNTATASTIVHAPVLTLAKTATASVNAGEAINYTITYANTGSGAAANVVISDVLPAGVYYSKALDLGAGPKPDTVTLNADGTRTLLWNVGAVPANSGPQTIVFTARPTLLALGGTSYLNQVSLDFQSGRGCKYPTLNASASTTITVVPPTRDPQTLGFWRNHPELWTAEILARIQATDQQYDSNGDGALSVAEATAMLASGGNQPRVLQMQLLATYFNLATRRINAGTTISSKTADRLGLANVRAAAIFAMDTLRLPVDPTNAAKYDDATRILDEINNNKSEVY